LAYNLVSGPTTAVIELRMMDQFAGKVIPGSEGAVVPIFSPDNQWLAYNTVDAPRKIRRIPVTGGTSIAICDGDFFNGGVWTDDDTLIFTGPKGLMRVAAGGGTPEQLTTLDPAKHEMVHVRPQMLPTGQLLFTVIAGEAVDFAVLDLKTKKYRTVAKSGANGRYVPSGHLTYVRGSTLFAVPFNLATLSTSGTEVPVVESVSTNGPSGNADYSVSDNGVLAYVTSDSAGVGTTLAWADRKGATQVLPGQSKRDWGTGRLSPDGHRVANAISSDKGSDIWVFDVERGTSTRLSFGGQNDRPIWTPDGRRLVYAGAADGKWGIYTVAADGSAKPELLLSTDAQPVTTSISPDGKLLVFDMPGPDKRRAIFTLPLGTQGAAAKPLHETSSVESQAQVSRDGRWIAYESTESGASEIYVQPFPVGGAKVRVSTQGGIRARWSLDGKELYYWGGAPNARLIAVDVQSGATFGVGPPHDLFAMLAGTTFDVTPDRNKFLVELTTETGRGTISTVTNWFDELRRRAPAKK
jgi:hypothetical protein